MTSRVSVWYSVACTAALLCGCTFQPRPAEEAQELTSEEVAALLSLFNADLGAEGTEVGSAEVEQAFANDAELLSAVRMEWDAQGQPSSMTASTAP